MPYNSSYKKTTYRKKFNPRYAKKVYKKPRGTVAPYKNKQTYYTKYDRPSVSTFMRSPDQMFPDIYHTKMKNEFNISWTGVSGVPNAFLCAGNGLHNPLSAVLSGTSTTFTAGVATTVYGLGNLLSQDATISAGGPYNRYRIISSTITVTNMNNASNGTDTAKFLCLPMDGNTLASQPAIGVTVYHSIAEMPGATEVLLAGQSVNRGSTIKKHSSTMKEFALRYKSQIEDLDYCGVYGTNPGSTWWWVFYWFPLTANTTPGVSQVQVEYDIEFFDKNSLASTQG